MIKTVCHFIFLISFAISAFAQKENSDYPQNYFRNPLDIPILLAGNFGECRPGHFHSGVDIKTKGEENQAVYAAADGFISRIKMEKGGFGHALYITHPNGYTTLYAHLNDFAPAIQKYVHTQQYEKEKWDVDLQLSPDQFPVKKGQQIAWSGNTGSSTAPHLHFEIRSSKSEHPLNPELFGLPIIDNTPPVIYEATIYDLHKSIYEQEPQFVPLKGRNNVFVPTKGDTITTTSPTIGIGINVKDFMNGSDNDIAFYTAFLNVDNVLVGTVKLDDIGYDETRYINAYADYKTHEQYKKWIQCLFEIQGNKLDHIYENMTNGRGQVSLAVNKVSHIQLKVVDDKGNTSNVSFYVKYIPGDSYKPSCPYLFSAANNNTFKDEQLWFTLPQGLLYDDICFRYSSKPDATILSNRHQVHFSYVPLHRHFELNIKTTQAIPQVLTNKVVMRYSDDKDEDGRAAISSEKDWYKASVRNFGMYWLAIDTTAPVIKTNIRNGAMLANTKEISFTAKDSLTSVKRFRGEIDGKWVCFEQHGDRFFYRFDEHCTHGRHQLVFKAADENNNERTLRLNFTR